MKWDIVKLSEVCDINPSKRNVLTDEVYVSFLGMANVSEEGRILNAQERTYKEVKKGFTSFHDNDILIAKITPCFENGKGALVSDLKNGYGFGSTEFHVVRPKVSVCPRYIFYSTRTPSFRNSGAMNMTGSAGQQRVSKDFVANYTIPLPPLHIQQQIADTLDKADALRQKDQQLLQKYDELAQSIFYDMFGDSLSNNKGSKVMKLKDVCLKITDGTHQSPKFLSSGIPFLFVSNIKDDSIVYDSDRFISKEEYQILYKRTPIQIGDILLTTVGSYGNPAVVESNSKFMFQRHIAYLKPDVTSVLPYFLFRQLKSRFVINQIENKVRGVAQKTLNLTDLNEIQVVVPKLESQSSFSKVEVSYRNMKSKVMETCLRTNLLFENLVNNYF